MPLSRKAVAIKDLRDAYLRLQVILTMNELEDDQQWIEQCLKKAVRQIGQMLRHLEPKRRLPSVLHDTRLGRALKEAEKVRKCKHDWRPAKRPKWLWPAKKGEKWEKCAKCESGRQSFPKF